MSRIILTHLSNLLQKSRLHYCFQYGRQRGLAFKGEFRFHQIAVVSSNIRSIRTQSIRTHFSVFFKLGVGLYQVPLFGFYLILVVLWSVTDSRRIKLIEWATRILELVVHKRAYYLCQTNQPCTLCRGQSITWIYVDLKKVTL